MKNILTIIKKTNVRSVEKTSIITFLNPHSYKIARKNLNLFNEFDVINVDGIYLVKLLNLFKIGKHTRKSFDMSSLAKDVFDEAIKKNKTIYFIGTEPNKIDKSIEVIRKHFLTLNIVGYRNGFFSDMTERNETLQNIKELNPDIVVCGMGTPLQEQFLVDLRNKEWRGTGYTCGGFLHQIIEGIQYFPDWSNKYNLRWLYRIIKEPEVNLKRNTIGFIQFLFVFIYDTILFKLNLKK